MYHSISESGVDMDPTGLFTVTPKKFEEQMKFLRSQSKLKVVHLTDGITELENCVSVTFDDGYRDNLTIALPIAQKYNIPITIFVSTKFVKENHPDFLTIEELQELSKNPLVTIGSHTVNHSHLADLDDDNLKMELKVSKTDLEEITGQEINMVAYPFGSTNKNVLKAVKEANYKFGFCSRFDINSKSRSLLMQNRCDINSRDCLKVFSKKIFGHWDWYRFRSKDPLTF
jgi:peptidoglycan/xylan/chitin deacetylase (PgdA/CDA1 family)